MRYNYCPRCNKAFVKSRIDRDHCIYCNGNTEPVNVRRNGLYFVGYGIMMAGAICTFIPRFMVVEGSMFYYVTGISMAIAGSVLVVIGSTKMAKDAAIEFAKQDEPETKE